MTKIEYLPSIMVAQECTWLIQLMKDLHQPIKFVVPLYHDNKFVIQLAENPVFHARTKCAEVHYHFLREKVLNGELRMKRINIDEQIVDIFIKELSSIKFSKFWT